MTHEQKFLHALKDVFIGAPVEGESGYINLMRIKARYFEQGIAPRLLADVRAALAPFPTFREELFDKLYSFFHRYFSESGSIYFRYTPLHQNVYARVYTDDRDVMLFWKTHMLYYVKTDRLFQNMEIKVDNFTFYFDVSTLQHKQANEKRALVFDFAEKRADGASGTKLVFTVTYSERGRKTKMNDIQRALRAANTEPREEVLERAFRLFERQSEVDYFINKDARAFLREQFDLWMYQYVFSETGTWTAIRVQQLQVLRDIAYKLIDFIAQFEDELVKVWNKPKFVRDSHYVITLDRIAYPHQAPTADEGAPLRPPMPAPLALLKRILEHPGMAAQVTEWRDLGMVGEDFRPEAVWQRDLFGQRLDDAYQYLPLDTCHFPDLELEILGLFDDLDEALDGWLVRSENYQALRTLEPKFRGQVKCVHIDPPYNTDTSGFLYKNDFRHSSWLTMMENRVEVSSGMLSNDGSFLCHIDENEYERLKLMFDQFPIPDAGTIAWDKRNPMNAGRGIATQHEYIIWRSRQETPIYLRNTNVLSMLRVAANIVDKYGGVSEEAQREYAAWITSNSQLSGGEKAYRYLDERGRVYQSVSLRAPEPRTDDKFHRPLIHPITKKPCPVPPNGFSRTPETLQAMVEKGEIIFGVDETTQPRQKMFLTEATQRQMASVIIDARKGKADVSPLGLDFPYCHPVSLYKELVGAAVRLPDGITLDFFAGSGTTAHAVMNLNREDGGRRKYILVEMGEHFETVILPRVKKVAFSDKWKDGQAQPGGQGLSHFVKVYRLEQYEDALRLARYEDADLFHNPYADPYSSYVFLRDLKMLDTVDLDTETESVTVHLDRLYPNIDLAETLSCVTGKPIRRITAEAVEFRDGTRADLVNPEWELVKPLIWW